MKIKIHFLAKTELRESAHYYENEYPGLGTQFLEAVDIAIDDIRQHPLAWPELDFQVRAIQIKRFGYRMFYQIDEDTAFIVAISHCSREPLYWIDRLES